MSDDHPETEAMQGEADAPSSEGNEPEQTDAENLSVQEIVQEEPMEHDSSSNQQSQSEVEMPSSQEETTATSSQESATDLSSTCRQDDDVDAVVVKSEDGQRTPLREVDEEEEEADEEEFLVTILSSDEMSLINDDVRLKIDRAVCRKINQLIVDQAELHAASSQQNIVIEHFRTTLDEKVTEIDDLKTKLKEAIDEMAGYVEFVETATRDRAEALEKCKKMEYEWQDFKTQRDLACDEKESLLTMIERRDNEVATLKAEKAELADKCESAISAKISAMENAQEVESMKINIEFKEKRLEQENTMLRSQLEIVTEDLEKKISELSQARRLVGQETMTLQCEVGTKTEEVRILTETVTDLRETNDKLTDRTEQLVNKIASQRESYDVQLENYHQELTAQRKLAELYKGICDDNTIKTEKLTNANAQLKELLDEATERYGILEEKLREKTLRFEDEIAKRDDCIQHLKKELEDANNLLQAAKQESIDSAIGSLSPSAAAASRLIKSGMTLTQIYTQYARVSEELALAKDESRRLNLYVSTIVKEIEEKAPLLLQQRADYEKAVAAAESVTLEMDRMIAEMQKLNQECAEAKKTSAHLKKENQRLKKQITDMSRQVCYLVKAVEEARGGTVHADNAYEMQSGSAQEVISKHLVTFGTIEDLQDNNQKLLALVRQLSEKQEAAEGVSAQQYNELQTQKDKLLTQVNDLMDEMGRQSKMLELIRNQSETFKKLYQQAMGGSADFEMQEVAVQAPGTPVRPSPAMVTSTPLPSKPQMDSDTIKKLESTKERLRKLEEELAEVKEKNKEREAELKAKLDKISNESREWMFKNSKLVAQAEYHEEKSKVLDTNIKALRKQVAALEDRNKTLGEINAKHEQSLCTLKDATMDTQSKLARAEVKLSHMQQELQLVKTSEARLIKEREALNREKINNSMLMSNIEGLRATLMRSEEEGNLRLELQLSEAVKECAALRNTLKEEKDRFKELTSSLERQTDLAKQRMEEEKTLADNARAELAAVQQDLEAKMQTITQLNTMIRDLKNQPVRSVIDKVSMSVDTSAQKVQELEKKVEELQGEVSRLQIQLTHAKSSNEQYMAISEATNKQLEEVAEQHSRCSQILADIEKERTAERSAVDSRIAVFEQEKQHLESERDRLQKLASANVDELMAKISSLENELHDAQYGSETKTDTITSLKKDLSKALEDVKQANELTVKAEERYAQEVVAHSLDLQSLAAVRVELDSVQQKLKAVESQLTDAQNKVAEQEGSWQVEKERAANDVQEALKRAAELEEQNASLHDTLQKLNADLELLQAKVSARGDTSSGDLETSLNTSTELAQSSHDQLMKVIKFLRQEKDISVTKSEVLMAECTRVKSQLALLQRQLDETTAAAAKDREASDVEESTAAKHTELLRKVESLNAMTDSNRLLRQERDRYKEELDELKKKLTQYEAGVDPLQAQITELKKQVEAANTEKDATAVELVRWKARAQQLSDRGKVSPEEWKRVNNERENLTKQLQSEKEKTEKLEASLIGLRNEITSLHTSVVDVKKQLAAETADKRRFNEELVAARQKVAQLEGDLNSAQAEVKSLTEQLAASKAQLAAKEAATTELLAKETQIKKIAKKYKTQFEQLQKTNEEDDKKREEEDKKKAEELEAAKEAAAAAVMSEEAQERLRSEGRAEALAQAARQEAQMAAQIKALQDQMAASAEEAETLRKDNETLKGSINDKEERAKHVLKAARGKIAQLQEELNQSRGHVEHSRDENVSALKVNYEATIARMEKERQEEVERANEQLMTRDNQMKMMTMRLNMLQKLLDKQKPSTSSQSVDKSPTEPPAPTPPTANIKPMAGSSTQRKQKQTPPQCGVAPYWPGSNDMPFARIGPVQTRTMLVQPTSVTGTSSSNVVAPLVVPLQMVHTTGSSEVPSSSPTSSHTDYMPATSSATPIRVVVAPTALNAQSSQEAGEVDVDPVVSPPAIQAVTPRSDLQTGSGPSSTTSQASSSNTVTTTQAGLKRPRDDEGDSPDNDLSQVSPQVKRTRSQSSEVFQQMPVTHCEGSEVEYQVPTSSQRDQEDEDERMVIMLGDSDDDNADDAEAEEADEFEEADNGDGYEMESYSRDGQDMGHVFEEGPDIDENNPEEGGNNEVEIIDDSNEVPVGMDPSQEQQQQSSEATSSGNDNIHVVVTHAASSQSFRTRSVPPLNRPQQSLQSYEEGGDDSIVPSTPILLLPREAVSSPQVPHQRFTFSEPSSNPRRDDGHGDDSGGGRSVPTTPLIASPLDVSVDQAEPSVPVLDPSNMASNADESMPSPDLSGRRQEDREAPETVNVDEDGDGVTSEGEKPPVVGGEFVEEGREAEASEPVVRASGTARRSTRSVARRGSTRGRPTPIVWNEPGSSGLPTNQRATRSRGRPRRNWPAFDPDFL